MLEKEKTIKQRIEECEREIELDRIMIARKKRGNWKEAYKFNQMLLKSLKNQLKKEE